tara:strand:+ start:574 stop:1050 length:477 start_codon:yes stop_codon:yes gene_type:complete
MKFKIFLYLFIFICILLFYQIFNTNKILNYKDSQIQIKIQNNIELKDSLKKIKNILDTNTYFSLKGNQLLNGLNEHTSQEQFLRKQLFEMNSRGGLDRLIELPQEIFLINNIKIVNQKWVLIGFQSDLSWGQAILEFKKNKIKNNYSFTNIKSFVIPL